jgi:DNA-binding NarL/FixJ family response regulator
VRDLVAGADLQFDDLGVQARPGISGEWHLYRVARGSAPPTTTTSATGDSPRAHSTREVARLTRREREVAALVARGLTNRQIGERLVIAESTAERHVINILNKLGQHSRSQIAVWATAQGLAESSTT